MEKKQQSIGNHQYQKYIEDINSQIMSTKGNLHYDGVCVCSVCSNNKYRQKRKGVLMEGMVVVIVDNVEMPIIVSFSRIYLTS